MRSNPYRASNPLARTPRPLVVRPRAVTLAADLWLGAGLVLACGWTVNLLSVANLVGALVGITAILLPVSVLRRTVLEGRVAGTRPTGALALAIGVTLLCVQIGDPTWLALAARILASVLFIGGGVLAIGVDGAYRRWRTNARPGLPADFPPVALALCEALGRARLRIAATAALATWARGELDAGMDTPTMRRLSVLEERDPHEIVQRALEEALREMRVEVPPRAVTDRCVIQAFARDIVSARVTPREGLESIYQVAVALGLPEWTRDWYVLRDTCRLTEAGYVAGSKDKVDVEIIACARRTVREDSEDRFLPTPAIALRG